jgi:hypothetical protein
MTRSLSVSARPVPSSVANPCSTNISEFGDSGGDAIGIWVIHGWRSIRSRWKAAHIRSLDRQSSPPSTNFSELSELTFHIS